MRWWDRVRDGVDVVAAQVERIRGPRPPAGPVVQRTGAESQQSPAGGGSGTGPAGDPAEHALSGWEPGVPSEPAWFGAVPLQRALDHAITPVAPLDTFTASLSAHQNPSFLAPLGHLVSADAPAGLVDGLAVPPTGVPQIGAYAAGGDLAVPAISSTAAKPTPTHQSVQRWVEHWSTWTPEPQPLQPPATGSHPHPDGPSPQHIPPTAPSVTGVRPEEPVRNSPVPAPVSEGATTSRRADAAPPNRASTPTPHVVQRQPSADIPATLPESPTEMANAAAPTEAPEPATLMTAPDAPAEDPPADTAHSGGEAVGPGAAPTEREAPLLARSAEVPHVNRPIDDPYPPASSPLPGAPDAPSGGAAVQAGPPMPVVGGVPTVPRTTGASASSHSVVVSRLAEPPAPAGAPLEPGGPAGAADLDGVTSTGEDRPPGVEAPSPAVPGEQSPEEPGPEEQGTQEQGTEEQTTTAASAGDIPGPEPHQPPTGESRVPPLPVPAAAAAAATLQGEDVEQPPAERPGSDVAPLLGAALGTEFSVEGGRTTDPSADRSVARGPRLSDAAATTGDPTAGDPVHALAPLVQQRRAGDAAPLVAQRLARPLPPPAVHVATLGHGAPLLRPSAPAWSAPAPVAPPVQRLSYAEPTPASDVPPRVTGPATTAPATPVAGGGPAGGGPAGASGSLRWAGSTASGSDGDPPRLQRTDAEAPSRPGPSSGPSSWADAAVQRFVQRFADAPSAAEAQPAPQEYDPQEEAPSAPEALQAATPLEEPPSASASVPLLHSTAPPTPLGPADAADPASPEPTDPPPSSADLSTPSLSHPSTALPTPVRPVPLQREAERPGTTPHRLDHAVSRPTVPGTAVPGTAAPRASVAGAPALGAAVPQTAAPVTRLPTSSPFGPSRAGDVLPGQADLVQRSIAGAPSPGGSLTPLTPVRLGPPLPSMERDQRLPDLPTAAGRTVGAGAQAPAQLGFAAMFGVPAEGEGFPGPPAEGQAYPPVLPVQRNTAARPVAAQPPSVQTETAPPAATAEPAPPPADTAPAAAPAAAAPTAGAAAATASAADAIPTGAALDEMARRLFEPLSARLRAELWLDRERAGLVTDLRP